MGVPGLRSYATEHERTTSVPWPPPRPAADAKPAAVIVVDGFAWLCHVAFAPRMRGRLGVRLGALAAALAADVGALRSAGYEPVVVLDGCVDDARMPVFRQRAAERAKMVDGWVKVVTAATTATTAVACPPVLPSEAALLLVRVLARLGVRTQVCPTEADAFIAALAAQLEAPIVSADSDMLVFGGGVPGVLLLGTLTLEPGRVQGRLYTRARLAASLGVAEAVVPLVAALVGNDTGAVSELTLLRLVHAPQMGVGSSGASSVPKTGPARLVRLLQSASLLRRFPTAAAARAALEAAALADPLLADDVRAILAAAAAYTPEPPLVAHASPLVCSARTD
jgi:5'-3' exonuclease